MSVAQTDRQTDRQEFLPDNSGLNLRRHLSAEILSVHRALEDVESEVPANGGTKPET
jgi:hypothetical protein